MNRSKVIQDSNAHLCQTHVVDYRLPQTRLGIESFSAIAMKASFFIVYFLRRRPSGMRASISALAVFSVYRPLGECDLEEVLMALQDFIWKSSVYPEPVEGLLQGNLRITRPRTP